MTAPCRAVRAFSLKGHNNLSTSSNCTPTSIKQGCGDQYDRTGRRNRGIGVDFVTLRWLCCSCQNFCLLLASVPLDNRVLGFTLSVCLLTSILFGMLPALTTGEVAPNLPG